MADLPSPIPRLIEAIESLLSEHGPMAFDEILDALSADGLALGDDPEELLLDILESDETPLIWDFGDDRHGLLPAVLAGRVFTRRVTGAEVAYDFLDAGQDLSPMHILLDDDRWKHLADGSPLSLTFAWNPPDGRDLPLDGMPEEGVLLLPPGFLSALGVGANDLVGLRLTADGLALERLGDATRPPDALAERLRNHLEENGVDQPMWADEAIWRVCVDLPQAWRDPLPPLTELLPSLGFALDDEWLALPTFDFRRWRTAQRVRSVRERYDLEPEGAFTVLTVSRLYEDFATLADSLSTALKTQDIDAAAEVVSSLPAPAATPHTATTRLVKDTLPPLVDPAVAHATMQELLWTPEADPSVVAMFLEQLSGLAPRSARPALQWILVRAHEEAGETAKAEAALGVAEKLDPSWPPTLIHLARYASDRGDAVRGLGLLRRANAPDDDDFVATLRRYQPTERRDMRRNEPCWCGSGRKYKQCHLGRESVPLDDRAAWLYGKATMHLGLSRWRREMLSLAVTRLPEGRYDPSEALADGLVPDVVLFECGALREFLDQRGDLLPADERLLAEQWLLIERSVFEIEAVRPGESLRLRDLRSGDRHDVRAPAASWQLRTGELICTRVLPAGETEQLLGGHDPVELHQRDALIMLLDSEPVPVDLVRLLSGRLLQPQLQNTDGERLVYCEATLRVPDPARLVTALDATYERPDAAEQRWHECVTTQGMERIRAVLRLDGDELRVETNSEARHERVIDALMELQPGVILIGERRQDLDDMPLDVDEDGDVTIDLTDPRIQESVQQVIEQYEQAWLDEPIPALAGVTPREAAADPTRRPDLIRLIESFPEADEQTIAMSPRRLREALDLT